MRFYNEAPATRAQVEMLCGLSSQELLERAEANLAEPMPFEVLKRLHDAMGFVVEKGSHDDSGRPFSELRRRWR